MSTLKNTIPVNGDSSSSIVRASVVQASTVYNDTPKTIEKAEKLIAEAASGGSELVVFPEAFIGGFPRGFRFGIAVGVLNQDGRDEFRKYHASAIQVPGPEVEKLAELARKYNVYLVMGAIEKDGYTLYCTALFFSSKGRFLGKHRKVMPTSMERCIWGFGDGSTIPVYDTPMGKLGAAICWENRMPLYRTALYGKGVELYCAPTADASKEWKSSMLHIALEGVELYCAPTADASKEWQSSMLHIALEGGCFVLSACQFCRRKDFPEHPDYLFNERYDGQEPDSIVSQGGGVIISPLGKVLAGPNFESEGLITAALDLGDIARAKLSFDAVGHYSRPEIFNLTVNEYPKKPVTFMSNLVKAKDDCESQDK